MGYSVTPVEYLADWEQKEQSSLQSPDLALTMEQRFTSSPFFSLLTFSVTGSISKTDESGSFTNSPASSFDKPSPESPLRRAVFNIYLSISFLEAPLMHYLHVHKYSKRKRFV